MLKFFLIIGIAIYVLYKLGSFFYRIGAASQHFRQYQEQKKAEFNQPKGERGKATRESKVNGGEYIDYEEVK